MNKETQQINRLDQKELIAMTAHDLRGIIARIYGLNRLVEKKLQDLPDPEVKKLAGLIASQCQQGLDMTAVLVDKYKTSICSLTELLARQIDIYRFQAENKGIELTADIHPMNIYIETQTVPLIRVLNNLFDNAVKFTPRSGRIKITLTLADNKAVISFRDTGIGIPQSFQPLLFEKSIQTQRVGTENEPSTGLGLFISKQLIEELNGTISYDSIENRGTTFYISLDSINNLLLHNRHTKNLMDNE